MQVYRHSLHALVALLVTLFPALVALDLGGVLDWDWWLLGVGTLGLVIAAAVGESEVRVSSREDSASRPWMRQILRWAPLGFCLGMAGLALAQSMPVSRGLVGWLAPASSAAYGPWLESTGLPPAEHAWVSIWPAETTAYAWRALVIAGFAFAAGVVYRSQHLVPFLLAGLTLAGLLHAGLGVYQQLVHSGMAWNFDREVGAPFGAFINRNNAGVLLNLGLAGTTGLLTLRALALAEQPDPAESMVLSGRATSMQSAGGSAARRTSTLPTVTHQISPADNAAWSGTPYWWATLVHWTKRLSTDPASLLGICGMLVILSALMMSGSRGALLGGLAGILGVLAAAFPARLLPRLGLVAVLIVVGTLISLRQLDVTIKSIDRLQQTQDVAVAPEGRFGHWPDAMRASVHYLPMGCGLGAYRYGYLPYQQTTGSYWALNADNLWVEWWVEGGLPLAVLVVLAVIAGVAVLRRLYRSTAPVDRALAAAAIFAICSIGLSQSFDFGLLQGPAAALTIGLASAVAARGTARDLRRSHRPPTPLDPSGGVRVSRRAADRTAGPRGIRVVSPTGQSDQRSLRRDRSHSPSTPDIATQPQAAKQGGAAGNLRLVYPESGSPAGPSRSHPPIRSSRLPNRPVGASTLPEQPEDAIAPASPDDRLPDKGDASAQSTDLSAPETDRVEWRIDGPEPSTKHRPESSSEAIAATSHDHQHESLNQPRPLADAGSSSNEQSRPTEPTGPAERTEPAEATNDAAGEPPAAESHKRPASDGETAMSRDRSSDWSQLTPADFWESAVWEQYVSTGNEPSPSDSADPRRSLGPSGEAPAKGTLEQPTVPSERSVADSQSPRVSAEGKPADSPRSRTSSLRQRESSIERSTHGLERLGDWFSDRQRTALMVRGAAAFVLVLLLMVSCRGLAIAATSDALVGRVEVRLRGGAGITLSWLEHQYEELAKHCQLAPRDAELWTTRAAVRIQQFRLIQATENLKQSRVADEQAATLEAEYLQMNLARYRSQRDWRAWRYRNFTSAADEPSLASGPDGTDGLDGSGGPDGSGGGQNSGEASANRPADAPTGSELDADAMRHLREAADDARQALRYCPLADLPRWQLIWMDFAITDPRRSEALLDQLASLRSRSAESQMEIADAAVVIGDWDRTIASVRSALELAGRRYISNAVSLSRRDPVDLPLSQMVPDSRDLVLRTVEHQHKKTNDPIDPELLKRARGLLDRALTSWEKELKKDLFAEENDELSNDE